MSLHQRHPKHIRRREKPAAAGRALVRDGRAFEWDLYVEDLLVFDLGGAGEKDGLGVCGGEC